MLNTWFLFPQFSYFYGWSRSYYLALMYKTVFILFLLMQGINFSYAQETIVKGTIIDLRTKEPLPFVNITFDNGRKGTVSGIDGYFELKSTAAIKKLTFSYVGYESYTLELSSISVAKVLTIPLTRKPVNIDEVTIFPTENPAHRIINKVIENRDHNNPEKMRSFSYTSYNKMYFTGIDDTLSKSIPLSSKIDSAKKDSSASGLNNILSKQHLFLIEYVSQRNFKFPEKNNEKILSSRVSGLKDPMFVLLATQMQSFSFYNDFFTILDKRFLNPISTGSTSKYFFLLEDTFYTEQHDTLFVLSYRPRKGKNFEGLKGVLYINSHGYAIQNVLASPVNESELFGIKIQQQYELIENKQWFPTQLNTDLLYKALAVNTGSRKIYMAAIGKSYLSNIQLEPNTDTIKFTNIELQIDPDASRKKTEFWDNYRAIPLSKKDSLTYQVIDSIGKAIQLDKKMKGIDLLMFGYLPWGIFNIDLRKTIGYNQYEGFKTGLGLATNSRLLSFASVGGFFTYGFKDKRIKYGVFTEFFPQWYSDTKLTLRVADHVTESGKISFLDEYFMHSTEFIREFFVRNMDKTKEEYLSFSFRTQQYLKLNIFFNHASKTLYHYVYNSGVPLPNTEGYNVDITEIGVQFKLAVGEKFMKTPRGMLLSLGTKYPIVWINVIKGVKFAKSDFNYTKFEAKISKTFITRALGKTQLQIKGAIADGDIPLSNLYSSQGCHINFSYDVENNFNTIRPGEFYSSEFLTVFFRQNFGSLLLSTKKFKPEIVFAANAGWGVLKNKAQHQGIAFKTMEKGYYETGVLINRLISTSFTNIGFGIFYRLGAYSFSKTADNFTYKFTMGFNF